MKFKLSKAERNWILYDVGNSAFILLVSTLIPIYFNGVFVSAILTNILWVVSLFGLCRILTRKRLFEFLAQARDKKEQILHL